MAEPNIRAGGVPAEALSLMERALALLDRNDPASIAGAHLQMAIDCLRAAHQSIGRPSS